MKKLVNQNKKLYNALTVISGTEESTLQELIDTKKVFEAMITLNQSVDEAKRALKVYDVLIEMKEESDNQAFSAVFEKVIEDIPYPV